jgi:hypothetical protein
MAIHEYRDFVLVANDVQKNKAGIASKFTVSVFDSPVGQGEKKETVIMPDSLPDQIRWLEERRLDADVNRQMSLGETLAGLLLPDYARRLFSASLARLRNGEGLRLRLRLADELADFPWEYMYIQDTRGERTPSSFLALDPRISIVRHEAIAVPGDWFEAPDSRRVVVAMATPRPHDRYPKLTNLPTEQNLISAALSQVAGIQAVYLPEYTAIQGDDIPGAKLTDLLTALMERTDVFHFGGHGEFAADMGPAFGSKIGEGAIILADAQNQAVPVAADRLAEALRGKGVRLVVLGACETGRRDGHNVWSSVAASLLKAGIPAVVAMQFTIKDHLAAAFSGAFYRALVAGFTVDGAVAMGRAAIRAETIDGQGDVRDWGVPVLYLRTPGGVVFNPVSNKEARQEAEEKLGHLFEQHVRQVPSTGRVIGPVIGTMQGQTVTVDQTVDERVSGLMLGSYAVSIQGGRLVVRQKADVVEGTMIGSVIDRLGGPPSAANEGQALAKLEEFLRWTGAPASVEPGPSTPAPAKIAAAAGPTCPNCHNPVQAGWKFCPVCRSSLPERPKYCTCCGAELSADYQYCARCGAKVA